MTDYSQLPDDQINRMVAEMLGKCIIVGGVTITAQKIPDYLHDPVALEDVKRWVESKVQRWEVTWNFELYSLSTWDDPFNVNVITGSLDTEAKAWCIAALMLKEAKK